MKRRTKVTVIALLLAGLAACGGDAANNTTLIDVAQAAARKSDRVGVVELAEWLIEERQDFVLVDVRMPDDVKNGQIGDARHIPIGALMTQDVLDTLPTDRKVVVYSNGSENAAKAAALLRVAGFDAHVLSGGYNAWHARILNPDIPAEELDGEELRVSAQRAYSCYFVGDRGAASAERPEIEFVPPVVTDDEMDEAPLPPAAEESC